MRGDIKPIGRHFIEINLLSGNGDRHLNPFLVPGFCVYNFHDVRLKGEIIGWFLTPLGRMVA